MDFASSQMLSEPSSDRTARPVQHPQPIDARESENFPEASAETENKVASEINAAVAPSAHTSGDVSQISIEIVVNTLLNRARILLLLKNRSEARQCIEGALECSRSSNNESLQQKCRDGLQQFRDGSGIYDPLIGRMSTLSRLSEEEGPVSDLEWMLRLATKYDFEFPYWVFDQATAGSQPLPTPRPQPVLPPAAQPDGSLTPASSSLPPTKVDLMVAGLRDPSVRQRRLPQRRPLSLAQSPRPTPVNKQVMGAFGSKPPSSDLKSARNSKLLSRGREHHLSPQARAPPPSSSKQRRHSSLAGEDATKLEPLPRARDSLDLDLKPSSGVGNADSMLSTDTPALAKLAETISANPSPQSDSSVATAVPRRPSILHSHTPPSLALQTSGSYVASALDSTVPHNHSPLREAFIPDPDPGDDTASDASTKVQPSTETCSSSKILEQLNKRPHDYDSGELLTSRVYGDDATKWKPVPSRDLRSPISRDHREFDATVPEERRNDSAETTDPASSRSATDTMRANVGRRNNATVPSPIKPQVPELKNEKQKGTDGSGRPEEQSTGPDWHQKAGTADSISSSANNSITTDNDLLAPDKNPTVETNKSVPENDNATQNLGHARIEALVREKVKHKLLDPSEKYFEMNPSETMTEQDRLDAERVINVILHEAILNMAPDVVMKEYLKYQSTS